MTVYMLAKPPYTVYKTVAGLSERTFKAAVC
jgi:hypothetical protein